MRVCSAWRLRIRDFRSSLVTMPSRAAASSTKPTRAASDAAVAAAEVASCSWFVPCRAGSATPAAARRSTRYARTGRPQAGQGAFGRSPPRRLLGTCQRPFSRRPFGCCAAAAARAAGITPAAARSTAGCDAELLQGGVRLALQVLAAAEAPEAGAYPRGPRRRSRPFCRRPCSVCVLRRPASAATCAAASVAGAEHAASAQLRMQALRLARAGRANGCA